MKSYREADTEMRERFNEMQSSVEGKVDEVMASFREQKLQVVPSASKKSTVVVPPPRRKSVRLFWWLWLAGVLIFLALGSLRWIESDPDELPVEKVVALAPTPAVSLPTPVSQSGLPLPPIADPVAVIEPTPASKPAKAKRGKSKKATRYSEDLTHLLQQRR